MSEGAERRGRERSVDGKPSFVRVRRSPLVSCTSWRARSKAACIIALSCLLSDQLNVYFVR